MIARIGLVLVALLILSAGDIQAQYNPLILPDMWMDANPTARSFGMGLTGATTGGRMPSLRNPASIGVWALSGDVLSTHNWERGGPGGDAEYDLSNSISGFSVNYTARGMERPPTVSLGLVYRDGRYRAGPSPEIGIFDERYLVTRTQTARTYAFGLGFRAGAEFGLGGAVEESDIHYTYVDRDHPSGGQTYPVSDQTGVVGYLVRIPVLHALYEWGFIETIPAYGDFGFDAAAAYGSCSRSNDDLDGYSFGFESIYQDLPFVSVVYIRDRDGSQRSDGWELALMGVVAIRRGTGRTKPPLGTFFDSERDGVITPDWSTEGYALDLGEAQRWARRLLDIETSPTVTWMLDHLDAAYETASFQNPENAPRGLGQVSVREWKIGLIGVTQF